MKRVFMYVQHLLGIGHLKRSATLAAALAAEGLEVTFASGGPAVPELMPKGVRVVQLPAALAADLSFKSLVDEQGRPVDDAWKLARTGKLLAAWEESKADVLLVELFPFGRRQMRFELIPLLEAAKGRALIACSVRDILGGSDPVKQDGMLATFERYFDHLLVHSDPNVIEFGKTFRHADRLGDRLHYTGFISDRRAASSRGETLGAGEVLVSAGGGAVGMPLLRAAMLAKGMTELRDRGWRILAGVNCKDEDFEELRRTAGDGVTVERFRPDFSARLAHCSLSISQAGYNTLMEVLAAGAPSVVVPFAEGGETEQTLRAGLLAERGLVQVVAEAELSPKAIAHAASRARRTRAQVDLDGARRSAQLVAGWT